MPGMRRRRARAIIPAVDGVVVILAGVAALGGAMGILRTFGSRFRVGRLLASTPSVSIAEALEIARSGRPSYVRITGRIDSETDFEDADHRPLVFRRTRFQAGRAGSAGQAGRWADFDVAREIVAFDLNEGLDAIAVDGDALDDGLIVVPRESEGTIGDLGDRAPEDLDDALPARVVVEHVSSVEHAIVVGVPRLGSDGLPQIGAGLGRPLILTTLEQPEAMRILAGGSTRRPRLAAVLLVAAVALMAIGIVMLALPGSAWAASPDPTAVTGSDTRSSGEGPGLVGAPLGALLGVLGIAILAMLLTLAFVRATRREERSDRES